MKFKLDFKEIINYVATKKFWVELIIMTLGMIVTACAVYYFLVPSKLIIGTISGLSIVISGICEKFFGFPLNVSTVIFVINAILLVLAYILIDKEFGIKTVYTALILGPMIGVLEKYLPYQTEMSQLELHLHTKISLILHQKFHQSWATFGLTSAALYYY